MQAAADHGMEKIAIAGGVASNGALRAAMEKACADHGYKFYRPSPIFCTDNAAMIGVAAYYEYIRGTRHSWDHGRMQKHSYCSGSRPGKKNAQ